MSKTKDLAIKLAGAIESLYLQNITLQAMLMMYSRRYPGVGDWKRLFADLQTEKQFVDRIHEQFAPLRQQISEDRDLAEVLEQFLRVSPPKADVN